MEARQRRIHQVEGYWLKHVLACERAGNGVRAYTQAHGLNEKTFYKWRQELSQSGRLTENAATPLFHRLKVVPASMLQDEEAVSVPEVLTGGQCMATTMEISSCCIRLPNGTVLELGGSLSPSLIGQWIQTAGSLPMVSGRSVQ